MFRRTRQSFLRFMLVVMLASFLSPSFGLGLVASHDQLAHASAGLEHADHDHQHSGPRHDKQDHQDAHSSIGHLLTHLSVSFFELPPMGIPAMAQAELPTLDARILPVALQPPFRPPRAILPL
jgi:hypothetical protein